MKKIFSSVSSTAILTLTTLATPVAVFAQATDPEGGAPGNVNLAVNINTPAGVRPPGSLAELVGIAVRAFFLIGGIAVVIMLLWGAVEWILSGGSKEKVDGARKKIINALIGLAILALAFLIARVIGNVVGFDPLNPPDVRTGTTTGR